MNIVKVPGINGLGKTFGCENAFNIILEYFKKIHTTEEGKVINFDSLELKEIHLDNSDLESANNLIYKNSFEILEKGSKTVFIGGDHSVSYPLGWGFLDFCQNSGKEPCLIVFDSHPDCMTPMKEPTHEEWLRALIEKGFPSENVLVIGLRNSWKGELDYLKEKKIKLISMNQLNENLQDTCDTIMEFVNGRDLYVSLDIDVVDPAFAPATGYPVPGGLTSRQIIYLMQRINKIKTLRAVDIVEINPEKDNIGLTVGLGAKILGELV